MAHVEHSDGVERPDCPICLEPGNGKLKTLNCSHTFHRECIDRWLRNTFTCPVCRALDIGNLLQREDMQGEIRSFLVRIRSLRGLLEHIDPADQSNIPAVVSLVSSLFSSESSSCPLVELLHQKAAHGTLTADALVGIEIVLELIRLQYVPTLGTQISATYPSRETTPQPRRPRRVLQRPRRFVPRSSGSTPPPMGQSRASPYARLQSTTIPHTAEHSHDREASSDMGRKTEEAEETAASSDESAASRSTVRNQAQASAPGAADALSVCCCQSTEAESC